MTPRATCHTLKTTRSRELRARQTKAESLLWQVLRGRRLCGLKFRRQYPIVEPFFADFACLERRLAIELDGEYHEMIYEKDQIRQQIIEDQNWTVLRFANEDVLEDVESVAIAICKHLDIEPTFRGKKPH